jgi:hypothetical protein
MKRDGRRPSPGAGLALVAWAKGHAAPRTPSIDILAAVPALRMDAQSLLRLGAGRGASCPLHALWREGCCGSRASPMLSIVETPSNRTLLCVGRRAAQDLATIALPATGRRGAVCATVGCR